MSDKQNPIMTVIRGYVSLIPLLDEPGHRVAALLTAQQAQDELDRMRRVMDGQAEIIKQLEAEIKELKAAK